MPEGSLESDLEDKNEVFFSSVSRNRFRIWAGSYDDDSKNASAKRGVKITPGFISFSEQLKSSRSGYS